MLLRRLFFLLFFFIGAVLAVLTVPTRWRVLVGVIGDVPAGALKLNGRRRNQPAQSTPAFGAGLQRFFVNFLQNFKMTMALLATVFVQGHLRTPCLTRFLANTGFHIIAKNSQDGNKTACRQTYKASSGFLSPLLFVLPWIQKVLSESSWNLGIRAFTFSWPKWKPSRKKEKIPIRSIKNFQNLLILTHSYKFFTNSSRMSTFRAKFFNFFDKNLVICRKTNKGLKFRWRQQ